MIAWHYTVQRHLPFILAEGALRPSDPHVADRLEGDAAMQAEVRRFYGNEKPALWFSLRQDWEPTANKGGANSRAETARVGGGLVRFGLDLARVPLTWAYHVNKSGIRKQAARSLARVAQGAGADPADWRVVYEAIPIAECVVEVFNLATETWEPFRPATE